MPKTRMYSVVNNRLHFQCPFCQSKRSLTIPPDKRRKSIRCLNCGELSHCLFNRRITPRQSQTGKAVMIISSGRELPIDLFDISPGGVGFDITSGGAGVSVKQEVKLKCTWNPRLLDQGRFVIRSVKGRRIGVQAAEKKFS